MSGMYAPSQESNRIDNVPMMQPGQHVCTLYGMCDLMTQDTGLYGAKAQLNLAFEFPQEMRVFFEGEAPKPCAVFVFKTFSLHEKAGLRKDFIEPMIGRKLGQNENFDISTLLGKHYVATIVHDASGKYHNITSINALDNRNMKMFDLEEPTLEQINDTYYWHRGMGFTSDNFAKLPKFLREKIKQSEEGKAHAAQGGQFAEPQQNGGNNNTPSAPAPASNYGGKVIEMIATDFTYDQYRGTGWTDEALVQAGKARWKQPEQPKAPQAAPAPAGPPSTPSAPQAPQGPGQAIQTPPTPQAPKPATKKVLKLKPEWEGQDLQEWYAAGHTDQSIVEGGYGEWVEVPVQNNAPQGPHQNAAY